MKAKHHAWRRGTSELRRASREIHREETDEAWARLRPDWRKSRREGKALAARSVQIIRAGGLLEEE